jgi:hypothetical protein
MVTFRLLCDFTVMNRLNKYGQFVIRWTINVLSLCSPEAHDNSRGHHSTGKFIAKFNTPKNVPYPEPAESSPRPNSEPHGATRQHEIAKTPAK